MFKPGMVVASELGVCVYNPTSDYRPWIWIGSDTRTTGVRVEEWIKTGRARVLFDGIDPDEWKAEYDNDK